jgi:hypothetical protein
VVVRVSAPAFNPGAGQTSLAELDDEQLRDQLDAWLIQQLVAGYGVSEKSAAVLVSGGWVLPVLDGVDEMDPPDTPSVRAAVRLRCPRTHSKRI